VRDLRDPQLLGATLLSDAASARSAYGDGIPLHEVWDVHTSHYVKGDVSKDDSMGKQCVREYRAELESRAAEGDKYAASALESIDAGKGVQGYDEAGA
jgi:hypothetical protein